ncbi:hypothetical protein K7X08_010638 [Anisodus acutangulus]|uniref:Glycine-rich protein n=1 Tax=Anisodus acutangulus TaxID=402998 RepID=A0A9Q1R9Q5_9SOLA|nr:hypothetical protein K7X08_010638 [Anisodus acutangulus]
MGSKTLLFLGLFLAIFFMISSEVVARELAETSNNNENEVHVDGHGGYYGGGGHGHGRYYGGGGHGHGGYYGGGGHGHGGGGCRYKCCKYSYGSCKRCCSYAGEAMDKVTEAQPHN